MGAALDAVVEYKLSADEPWRLWDGGRDEEDYPKFDAFILRGGLLYRMLGWLPDAHGIRFPRKGAPRDMSAGLDDFLYKWADVTARHSMSYLSFAELIDAMQAWDEIVAKDGDPATATVTLRAHARLARDLIAGIGLPTPAVAVRLVYWFS